MSDSSLSALISDARQGSVVAFGSLVELHQDRLYRFLLSRSRTHADAEDAMQEAFVNAFRYLHTYDQRWQFTTWLYKIALRELGKISRAGANQQLDSDSVVERAADPLAACIESDQRKNLWLEARTILSSDAFTVLWLRYAEDMPVKDVAKVMGRPATWVKVLVHRAKKRLAKKLIKENHLASISAELGGPSKARPIKSSELVDLELVESDGSRS